MADELVRELERKVADGDLDAWAALAHESAKASGSSTWCFIERSAAGARAAAEAGWREMTLESPKGHEGGRTRQSVYALPVASIEQALRLCHDVVGAMVVDVVTGSLVKLVLGSPPSVIAEGWSERLTDPPKALVLEKSFAKMISLVKGDLERVLRIYKKDIDRHAAALSEANAEIQAAQDALAAAIRGVYAAYGYPCLPGGRAFLTTCSGAPVLKFAREGEDFDDDQAKSEPHASLDGSSEEGMPF